MVSCNYLQICRTPRQTGQRLDLEGRSNVTNGIQYSARAVVRGMKLGNGLWEQTRFNNRINKTVNNVAFQYDSAGNLIQKPHDSSSSLVTAHTMKYDAENRQVESTRDGVTTT